MIIEFGEINYKLFILLLYPIFIRFRKIVRDNIDDNYYLELFRFYLSYILCIIFTFIIKKRTRTSITNNKSINKSKDSINTIKNEEDWINPLIIREEMETKTKQKKKIAFIILISFFCLITNLFYIIFRIIYATKQNDLISILLFGNQSIGLFFEIIYFLLLAKPLLKNKIYKHHFLSLIIIFFNIVLLFINFVHTHNKETMKIIYYYLFYNFLFCMSYILGKKYLTIFYIAPYNLMVYIGIITCFILLLYDIISYLIFKVKSPKFNGIILGFKNNLHLSFIFFFIFDILLFFLTNMGIWLTIYYFTPFHFIISEFISNYVYSFNFKKSNFKLFFLIYIINLFFSLVFNEIIILNIFSLNYNTKKYIQKRERDEYLLSQSLNLSDYSSNTFEGESVDI